VVLYVESLLLYHFYIENKLISSECTCIYVKYIARNVKQPGVSTMLATSVYDFLLMINTNLPLLWHRFQVMADYSSNFR